ncbi:hypothetical protein BK126_28300 [Paenibacillus sp. FSL H7-0326]|uniref:hypothetical protein n=1 Tax=Paenibacillus sp. FSL H7-0326 TaxID=1921144 RepID=UPI00096D2416|nr:hypothetical protein [Paenibacillus sp. FSL H7-0326]OMC62769.1 hypothetical protein BK126_28300 [Paenibacillus sp. FSL H7-0326]
MRKIKSTVKVLTVACSLLLLSSSLAFADTGTSHIKKGSISGGASSLTYWLDASVASYGFTGSIDNGAAKWDESSSGIGFTKITSSTNASIKIFIGNHDLPANTYGEASYWNLSGQQVGAGAVTDGSSFQQARIILDAGNQSDAKFESSHRYKTSGHEIGHVLGLNHFENAPAHSGDHWMKSGKIALTSPTSTDLAHVRTKWGW